MSEWEQKEIKPFQGVVDLLQELRKNLAHEKERLEKEIDTLGESSDERVEEL